MPTNSLTLIGKIKGVRTEIADLTNIKDDFAAQYNESKTYNLDDFVMKRDKLYRAKENDITGPWDETKWNRTSVCDTISDPTYRALTLVAPAYSSMSTYPVGCHVTYNDKLYRCNTAINTPEDFDAAKWTQTNVINTINMKATYIVRDLATLTDWLMNVTDKGQDYSIVSIEGPKEYTYQGDIRIRDLCKVLGNGRTLNIIYDPEIGTTRINLFNGTNMCDLIINISMDTPGYTFNSSLSVFYSCIINDSTINTLGGENYYRPIIEPGGRRNDKFFRWFDLCTFTESKIGINAMVNVDICSAYSPLYAPIYRIVKADNTKFNIDIKAYNYTPSHDYKIIAIYNDHSSSISNCTVNITSTDLPNGSYGPNFCGIMGEEENLYSNSTFIINEPALYANSANIVFAQIHNTCINNCNFFSYNTHLAVSFIIGNGCNITGNRFKSLSGGKMFVFERGTNWLTQVVSDYTKGIIFSDNNIEYHTATRITEDKENSIFDMDSFDITSINTLIDSINICGNNILFDSSTYVNTSNYYVFVKPKNVKNILICNNTMYHETNSENDRHPSVYVMLNPDNLFNNYIKLFVNQWLDETGHVMENVANNIINTNLGRY